MDVGFVRWKVAELTLGFGGGGSRLLRVFRYYWWFGGGGSYDESSWCQLLKILSHSIAVAVVDLLISCL